MLKKPDVIVCPAQEWGVTQVLLKENRWYAIPISKNKLHDFKFLAIYEKKPVKAIRYIGKIKKIQLFKKTGKYEIILDGSVKKIKPIKRSKENGRLAPQSRQYTFKTLIDNAEWLEDIFGETLKKELNSDLTS